MPNNKIPEFILLSELINKLRGKEYYRVFAKTLLMTVAPDQPIPPDEELVKEMFQFFIKDKQLEIHFNNTVATHTTIESEVDNRASEKFSSSENLEAAKKAERKFLWDNEIYVKVKNLKKLYANKCIVLPNSLFINKNIEKNPSIS